MEAVLALQAMQTEKEAGEPSMTVQSWSTLSLICRQVETK